MERLKYQLIAVDYDDTIAPNAYPEVGTPYPEAVRVLKRIKEHGGKLIIWTCRTGEDAEKVKSLLANAGVEYDAFNDNLPETMNIFPDNSRKVFADVYIDDKANFCKGIDWLWVEENLFHEG